MLFGHIFPISHGHIPAHLFKPFPRRDIDGVIHQYLDTVKPMHRIYVDPTKKYADIILNGGMNKTALDVVAARIAKRLEE